MGNFTAAKGLLDFLLQEHWNRGWAASGCLVRRLKELPNRTKTMRSFRIRRGFLGGDIMNQSVERYVVSNHGTAVLLVDQDLEYLEFVREIIQRSGHSVDACSSYTEGVRQLESGAYDLVVVGQGSRNFEGRCVLEFATAFDRNLPVIVVARNVEMGCYLEAMQLGAVDYISPGLSGSEITRAVQTHTLSRKSRSGNVKCERATAAVVSAGLVA